MSAVTPLPIAPSVNADAKNRAWRTLAQGLAVDVGIAVLITIGPMLTSSEFAFSKDYLGLIVALAAKTAIMTAVSYISRKLVPPSF